MAVIKVEEQFNNNLLSLPLIIETQCILGKYDTVVLRQSTPLLNAAQSVSLKDSCCTQSCTHDNACDFKHKTELHFDNIVSSVCVEWQLSLAHQVACS